MINDVREILLQLPPIEKRERRKALRDYLFYKGKCINKELAKVDKVFLGQSWENNDNVDYEPTEDIRNKVKPLLKKQARFMFGVEPTITIKPDNANYTDSCEELRKFINDILENNKFWKNTRKAFLMSTIKKRVLLRVEVNPGAPISIKYENIEDFYYKEKNEKLLQASFFQEDDSNVFQQDDTKKIYYVHTYYYDRENENSPIQAYYKKQTYSGNDLNDPIEETIQNTGFDVIPCWLIKNGGELNDDFGESDLEDLRGPQTLYNKKNSDYADALKFQMFGAEAIIDGNEEDVNKLTIAPNALHAIRTEDAANEGGKQATIQRLEYSMGNAEAANNYLDRIDKDMRDILDMPNIKDLSNIPSAKAMKYMYNDLIARCEEKWTDWEPVFKSLISFIIQSAKYSYNTVFKDEWLNISYTMLFKHNYPIPDDIDDKKKTAIEEVQANVRSHKDYIKTYGDVEDADGEYEQIIQEISDITAAENDQMQTVHDGNLDE